MKTRLKNRRFLGLVNILSALFMLLSIQNVKAEPKKYRLGEIPLAPEAYKKHLKKIPIDTVMIEILLPPAYDARVEGIVTVAKNQGNCGSCWAFACEGALESHLLKAGMLTLMPDYAEQQQVSCNKSMWGCSGGNSDALLYWTDKGPLNESSFPYTASDSTPCVESDPLDYRVTDYHTVPVSTAAFKESLYLNGPSYWRFTVHTDFFTFWGSYNFGAVYVNQSKSVEGGHAVLLIGWDDTKQAFLCKNSWGNGGPNGDGTFWIAYAGHANDLGFGMANFNVLSLTCSSDAECSDGIACNGLETCVNSTCQPGTPKNCPNDGLFCNGSEYCAEPGICAHTQDVCIGQQCIEEDDVCEPLSCRNGICDAGENCMNCDLDCISGTGGGTCSACFKGTCNGSCNPTKEGPDCTDCAPAWCCGDGVCNGVEDSSNCALDCGQQPISEICIGGIDEDGDSLIDCADPDCYGDPVCSICLAKKAKCTAPSECCSGNCVRGICR